MLIPEKISAHIREEAEKIRADAEQEGKTLTNTEYEFILQYAARKCCLNGKGEDYILIMLADEIRDYFFRCAVNAITLQTLALA